MRQTSEQMRRESDRLRLDLMKIMEAQEKAREAADKVRQTISDQVKVFMEEAPKIVEDLRRAAAKQWEEAERVSDSAREMLRVGQQILQKALEQMGKARS